MKNLRTRWLTVCSGILLTSCGTQTVVVNSDTGIVRLGADVSGHVYTWDGKAWTLSRNKVALPEGWYATAYHAK